MADTTADSSATGFVARNNQVIGSVLSIVALLVSVGLGAGLMFWTNTRGVSAILTVLTIAGGMFTLLLLSIGASLRAITPPEQWADEDGAWYDEMGLDAPPADQAPTLAARLVAPLAVLAIVVGLSLSVVRAAL